MGSEFAVGKKAFGFCDRCGFRYLLVDLRVEVVDLQDTSIKVCSECFDPDQPQLQLGRYEFNDPQALRNPRPDTAQAASRFGVSLRYDFDSDAEYFVGSGATVLWQSDKTIKFTGASNNPRLIRDGVEGGSSALSVDAATYDKVRCQVKLVTQPVPLDTWEGAFYWYRTTDSAAYVAGRKVLATAPVWIAMGSQTHVVTWDLNGVTDWDGTVAGVRFDFFDFQSLGSYTNGALEIDYVRFESDNEQT
tara:strand:+ start:11504 stop:12244 length:741 start_codon:yes stop_codon:yes gene_type:complete